MSQSWVGIEPATSIITLFNTTPRDSHIKRYITVTMFSDNKNVHNNFKTVYLKG